MAQDDRPDRFVPCVYCTGDVTSATTWPPKKWVWRRCGHPEKAGRPHCVMNRYNLRVGDGEILPLDRFGVLVCKLYKPLKNRL